MPSSSDARGTDFTVRCACGIAYHTNDAHVGKVLPCKCGRTLSVTRPPTTANEPGAALGHISTTNTPSRERSRRRKVRTRRDVSESAAHSRVGRSLPRFSNVGTWFTHWVGARMEPFWFGTPLQRITVVAAWLYLIGVFASWMLLRYWSEENILATLIAYGPRTVALWPLALLVPAAVFWGRSSLWLLAIAAGIIVFPILGVRVSPGTWNASLPATPAPGTVRILTFNTQSGGALSYDLSILLREFAPDVFTFQECGDQLWAAMEAEKGWFTRRYGSLCTGSRWKIERIDSMPRADLERVQQFGFGGAGFVLRTVVQSPMGRFAVINLHLETARRGLEGMFGREGIVPDSPFPGGQAGVPADDARQAGAVSRLERFRVNTMIRNKESALASRWVTTGIDDMPYLIAGDFNLPVESTIFRAHWGHFVNAFEATGNGLGWTKHEGRWLRIRIDHVLSGERGFMPLFVRAVPDYRSDHRPVVADYKWPGSS